MQPVLTHSVATKEICIFFIPVYLTRPILTTINIVFLVSNGVLTSGVTRNKVMRGILFSASVTFTSMLCLPLVL